MVVTEMGGEADFKVLQIYQFLAVLGDKMGEGHNYIYLQPEQILRGNSWSHSLFFTTSS